jgi:histidine phosphotransferase ChpT
MQVDLKVVQLLCSRLCHDLIGPTGAVHNGMELFEEMGADGGDDALKMVSASVDQLSARLGFFRIAFGLGGLSGRKSPLSEARQLAGAFLEGGRINLNWPVDGGGEQGRQPSTPVIKLLLNMILVAIDALPRGGVLSVSLAYSGDDYGHPATGVAVRAAGVGAALKEDLRATLFPSPAESGPPALNAHNIHGFFCHQLALELASDLEVSAVEDEVRFAILVQEQNDR